ncbi:MAG: hypothetical protein KJ831_02540 [Candidatus Eisenbacteria bacterium]|nr:hypothetical protein [Candidatus Eisenbacteria bacterium]
MSRYLENIRIPVLLPRRQRAVNLLARAVLLKKYPKKLGEVQLVFSAIRLVDDAKTQYRNARAGLLAFARTRAANGYFWGVCSLETCILSLYRAVRLIEAFRRSGYVAADGKPVIPRSKGASILAKETFRRLTDLRHAIQHLDDRILNGELPRAQALGPRPQSTVLKIGRYSVRYRDLRDWITEADHVVARMMLVEQETQVRPNKPLQLADSACQAPGASQRRDKTARS